MHLYFVHIIQALIFYVDRIMITRWKCVLYFIQTYFSCRSEFLEILEKQNGLSFPCTPVPMETQGNNIGKSENFIWLI